DRSAVDFFRQAVERAEEHGRRAHGAEAGEASDALDVVLVRGELGHEAPDGGCAVAREAKLQVNGDARVVRAELGRNMHNVLQLFFDETLVVSALERWQP